jgi:fucose 4-O-acetylase-like acetyltransferase
MRRNRYVDLLRVTAISAVVLGHWLLTSLTYRQGVLSGQDALQYVAWGRWLTLPLQVMPVFFLVGGYADAVSWTDHHADGTSWTTWVQQRALRLLWPTTVYVLGALVAACAVRASGANTGETAQAGWYLALHLWFLPVYLVLVAATPLMLAAHRRWGLAVPAAMAVAAGAVDIAAVGGDVPLIGFANYLLVWGCMHQWGFAWQDRSLVLPPWRPWALAACGAVALALLLALGPFPVDMIGAGQRVGNTNPPSVALLALAALQTGLLLAAEPWVTPLLEPTRRQHRIERLNAAVMTVYLWHLMPVLIVAETLYTTGLAPQPAIGTAGWWALRPAWFAVLGATLLALTTGVLRIQPALQRLPSEIGSPSRGRPLLLALGLAAVSWALARLAIDGVTPDGRPAAWVLATYVGGLATVLLADSARQVRRVRG